ncbi:hypothetical protein COEREDRAFT_86866 [Coemansia reversa NRRL 1564]|uniref:Uncharacterized protein n=1 Tax=Coemansia reversa (strain ATCC 12441 / NRRL 1564) TaxID=763665 RepID=A0A2G5BBT4_COERN|nr:hypothetical protein COEREDRAFT_86866 [Coemansia reversa NRRL 1564]|eukprot:PIA16461.1 hypothetical protein COEREDRAFT_86866 [Coemansia reversa NRRL 1564]
MRLRYYSGNQAEYNEYKYIGTLKSLKKLMTRIQKIIPRKEYGLIWNSPNGEFDIRKVTKSKEDVELSKKVVLVFRTNDDCFETVDEILIKNNFERVKSGVRHGISSSTYMCFLDLIPELSESESESESESKE